MLIDPDQDGGATLNPLEGDDHDLVVDNLVSIFSNIFAKHWGPRMDDVLRVACLTLLRHANATLPLVPPLLNDKQFRARVHRRPRRPGRPARVLGVVRIHPTRRCAPRSSAPVRVAAAGSSCSATSSAAPCPPRRPASTWAGSSTAGSSSRGFPKGQIGEDDRPAHGLVRVRPGVAGRHRPRPASPRHSRRDAAVYIDEAHNFLNLAGGRSTDMLAEARGYHLSLVLAHQNLAQLPRETQLALSANARNKIFFSCAPEDAHQLARHTIPELSDADLAHLDAYTAAARLVAGNRTTAAFTLRTAPPAAPVGETTAIRQAVARPAAAGRSAIEEQAHLASRRRREAASTGSAEPAAAEPGAPPAG